MRGPASLLIALFLAPSCLSAAVYDVGANTTFANFSSALIALAADAPSLPATETVTVRAYSGTYNESVQPPLIAQPLVIMAVPGYQPLLNASGAYGIRVSGLAGVLVQGISIRNFSQAGIFAASCPGAQIKGNSLESDATEIRLQDCPQARVESNVMLVNGSGILAQNSPGLLVRANRASASGGSGYSSGITLTDSQDSSLSANRLDGALNGIVVISSDSVSISANAVVTRLGGIQGFSLDNSSGAWLFNNLAVGQQVGFQIQNSQNAGLHNNTVWDHFKGLSVKNSSGAVLRNNIIQGDTGIDTDAFTQAGLDSQYNDLIGNNWLVVSASTYANLAAWQGTGNDTVQSLSVNPSFANPSGSTALDFILQPGTPVQGIGQNLSSLFSVDFFDNLRPALGNWEPGFHALVAASPTPTPTATVSPVVPTATISPTASPTRTPVQASSPTYTVTVSPTRTPSPPPSTTPTTTPYPIRKDKLVSYPNPFNPNAGQPLNFVFDPAEDVSIKIFDIAGGFIAELPQASILNAQGYANWDGRSASSELPPAGLYFAILRSSKGGRFTRFTIVY